MSHTTRISAVKITDIGVLRAAVADLQRQGIKIALAQNKAPRAYSTNQQGMGVAPYVVEIPDARYDVGLYGDAKQGYEAATDFYTGSVEAVLGVKPKAGEDINQARLGKLYQAYAVNAAEKSMIEQGYAPVRSVDQDGSVLLTVQMGE